MDRHTHTHTDSGHYRGNIFVFPHLIPPSRLAICSIHYLDSHDPPRLLCYHPSISVAPPPLPPQSRLCFLLILYLVPPPALPADEHLEIKRGRRRWGTAVRAEGREGERRQEGRRRRKAEKVIKARGGAGSWWGGGWGTGDPT